MFKTNAFVLRRQDFREYDRIYTLYSDQYGKISLLARGARKIKSKLAPHLEGLNEVRLNFAKGKIFNHLSGANVVSINRGLLNDGEKIAFISDCFYLLDRFIKPEEGDARIYELVKEVFNTISNVIASPVRGIKVIASNGASPSACPAKPKGRSGEGVAIPHTSVIPHLMRDPEIASSSTPRNDTYNKIRVYFFWRLVDLLGYRPQLDECALCGRSPRVIPAKAGIQLITKFNITDNIIICSNCVGDGLHIQENTLENLRKIFQSNLAEFLKIELDNQLIGITEKAKQIKLSEL